MLEQHLVARIVVLRCRRWLLNWINFIVTFFRNEVVRLAQSIVLIRHFCVLLA